VSDKFANRYSPADYSTPRGIRNAHYDRLRDSGVSRENAARIADRAVEKTQRKIDEGVGLDAGRRAAAHRERPGSTDAARNPYRVRFDWEPEDAGIAIAPTPKP
jgi:hypothetical protein